MASRTVSKTQGVADDTKLRHEIDRAFGKLDKAYGNLNARLVVVQSELEHEKARWSGPVSPPAPTAAAPGFDVTSMGKQLRESMTAVAVLAERVSGTKNHARTHEAAIRDAQSKIDKIHKDGVDPIARGRDARSTAAPAEGGAAPDTHNSRTPGT